MANSVRLVFSNPTLSSTGYVAPYNRLSLKQSKQNVVSSGYINLFGVVSVTQSKQNARLNWKTFGFVQISQNKQSILLKEFKPLYISDGSIKILHTTSFYISSTSYKKYYSNAKVVHTIDLSDGHSKPVIAGDSNPALIVGYVK